MNLTTAIEGKEYIIRRIETDDEELDAFLFSLGCYSGEPITVVSRRKGSCTVSIKDGRYNIDNQLAEAIIIWSRSAPMGALFLFFRVSTVKKHSSPPELQTILTNIRFFYSYLLFIM